MQCNSKPSFILHSFIHSFLFSHQMANLPTLKLQLYNHIRSMYDEGTVNQQFLQLQAMRQPFRRDAVLRLITSYCLTCKNLFSFITLQLDQERIDFGRVNDLAQDFYARTCGIGAEAVRRACAELIQAAEKKDKDACSLALYWTKNRFSYLRGKFETLVQMERNIINLENIQ